MVKIYPADAQFDMSGTRRDEMEKVVWNQIIQGSAIWSRWSTLQLGAEKVAGPMEMKGYIPRIL